MKQLEVNDWVELAIELINNKTIAPIDALSFDVVYINACMIDKYDKYDLSNYYKLEEQIQDKLSTLI